MLPRRDDSVMVSYDEQKALKAAREIMIHDHLQARGITDSRVLEAMRQIGRDAFVNPQYAAHAYEDRPLPIGMGQTISQPYIVALMTQALEVGPEHEVLELGTGSGYQTAVLARLARRVYTVERFAPLTESAQAVLGRLGIDNVEFAVGDGSAGWPEAHTFDRIIVTAAVPRVPPPVNEQLKEKGLLVAPVGGDFVQELIRYHKHAGQLQPTLLCGCRFVKLVGKYGFDEGYTPEG